MNEEIRKAWETLIRFKLDQILFGYLVDLKIEEESMSLSIIDINSDYDYGFDFKNLFYDEEMLAKIMALLCGGSPIWGWGGGDVFHSIENILEGVDNE